MATSTFKPLGAFIIDKSGNCLYPGDKCLFTTSSNKTFTGTIREIAQTSEGIVAIVDNGNPINSDISTNGCSVLSWVTSSKILKYS